MDFNALLKGQKTDYVQTLPEMEDASMQVVAGERLRRFTQINYSLSSTREHKKSYHQHLQH